MKKVFLRDGNGKALYPDLVRYFAYQNDSYLIYTFHEIDESNFVKLYVVKVQEKEGAVIAKYIEDDFTWKKMTVIIKQLLKEIRNEQLVSFEDLDMIKIVGMQIEKAREFKLGASLVHTLTLQKPNNKEKANNIKGGTISNQNKISLLQELKHRQYHINSPTEQKDTSLEDASMPKEMVDLCSYQKLQEENAFLKRLLLQCQVRYETVKSLYAKRTE